jgi:hypothetical protein
MKAGDGPSDRATRLYTEAGALFAEADWLAKEMQTSGSSNAASGMEGEGE